MKRLNIRKVIPPLTWTTDQDIYLIENSSIEMSILCANLPFSEDQIMERKKILGLVRRDRQMRNFQK